MKNRNIFWGLLFIITAVLIVIDNTMVDGLEIGVVQILITVFMLCFIIKSITKLFWPGVLFPLAVLYLIYSKYIYVLSLSPLSTWQVLLVALFGSIGLSLVFKKKPKNLDTYSSYGHMGKKLEENTSDKNHTFFSESEQDMDGQNVYIKTCFGQATRYIKSRDLQRAEIENSFGESSIYFDEVKLVGGEAQIHVTNRFGELNLYLPKEWSVTNNIYYTLANVKECGKHSEDGPKVVLSGNTSFGEIKIIYI